MYHIRQEELFSFEQLMEMENIPRADVVLEHLPVEKILHAISGGIKTRGRPETINTRAMIYSLIIAKMERIHFVKDLIHRLKESLEFRTRCRFTGSDRIPSEASYSRLITKLQKAGIFQKIQEDLVKQAMEERFLEGDVLAIDSTHLEAFDRNPKLDKDKSVSKISRETDEPTFLDNSDIQTPRRKPEKPRRNKPGPVPKAEKAEWEAKLAAYKASLSLFERDVADMLAASYHELQAELPQEVNSGAKGDPRVTKRVRYWFGYKVSLVVDCKSQYIVASETSSANVNEQRMAIMLLKYLQERLPDLKPQYVLADKGYDGQPVYLQVRNMGAFALIPLIHRGKLPEGMDKHLRPICKQGHSYVYDSYDAKRDTVKFTRPKECANCPFQADGCQKVFKFRVKEDVRRFTAPGRGSKRFTQLFKQRTAIERVFSYLKLYMGLGLSRKLKKRALVDIELSCLAYNLSKLALDRLNKKMLKSSNVA